MQLKMGADIEEQYNDNVFFVADNAQDDFITRIRPWLNGGWKTEAVDLRLVGRADFYDYGDNDVLDAVDQSYNGSLLRRWNPRFSTTLMAAYLNDERRERELAETGLLFNDDNRQRQTYGLEGQYQFSELSAMSLAYNYQNEAFDDERTYDLQAHLVQLSITRSMAPDTERTAGRLVLVGGLYEYGRNYVTSDPFMAVYRMDVDDDQTIEYYSIRVGVSHYRTERLLLNVDMGARFTRVDNTVTGTIESNPFSLTLPRAEEEDESWGYVAKLEAVYSGEKWELSALASHDLVPASGRDGTTERTTLRFDGNGRIVSQWYYHWSARGYLNRSDDSDVTSDDDELTVRLQAGLRYVFNPRWSLGASWLTTWIDDRENNVDRAQNVASLRLQWNWPILE
ncbi:MAG: hypothetical protein PVH87_05575 [Desulfobacteraceae bacterium]